MRAKLVTATVIAGLATALAGAPAANAAADGHLSCVKHTVKIKGNDKILTVRNKCGGTVKVNVHQSMSDSGYKAVSRGSSRKFTGGKYHYVCGLKIYYKGTRYYNRISGPLGDC